MDDYQIQKAYILMQNHKCEPAQIAKAVIEGDALAKQDKLWCDTRERLAQRYNDEFASDQSEPFYLRRMEHKIRILRTVFEQLCSSWEQQNNYKCFEQISYMLLIAEFLTIDTADALQNLRCDYDDPGYIVYDQLEQDGSFDSFIQVFSKDYMTADYTNADNETLYHWINNMYNCIGAGFFLYIKSTGI